MLRIDVITLFPDMFNALNYGITGRAQKNNLIDIHYWNPRDFTQDLHRTVDDRPYGGGPGMVMKVAPLQATIKAAKSASQLSVITSYLSPQGRTFSQEIAFEVSQRSRLLLIAGRYEGIDERLIQSEVDEQWSIGDFVLSGGELAAMSIIDAVTRLLPDALGHECSAQQDSFSNGLLDYPHYTRPEDYFGLKVPEVLLSGNHEAIAEWRLQQSLGQTWLRRPDLLKKRVLTEKERVLLAAFIRGQNQ